MTKKIIVGIFAHPDDEAFGPSGTLLLEARAGSEVHIITLTAGQNGMNPDGHDDLGEVRRSEWHTAGKLIGATGMHMLDFIDGHLDNIAMVEASVQVEAIIRGVIEGRGEPLEVEIMSMDLTGITGHIDHIVAGRMASHVFYKLKRAGLPLSRLRLTCIPRAADEPNIDWLYMEPGRTPDEIDETIDTTSVREELKAIARAHHTQRSDAEHRLTQLDQDSCHDYFIVRS